MANFGKYVGQSTRGWDPKKGEQTLGLGQTVELGLWGGGPGGVDLDVKSDDPALATVHERPRPSASNWRNFVVTGLQPGRAKIRACLPKTNDAWAEAGLQVTSTSHGVRLVFFPGERTSGRTLLGTIYVIGGHGERFSAAGGPLTGYQDRGGHTAESTPPGRYTLGTKVHVTTSSWPMSVIPFGATLRLRADGEVEFSSDGTRFRLATGPKGEVTTAQMAFLQRDGKKPQLATVVLQVRRIFVDPASNTLRATTWEANDFGRWGWNLKRGGQRTAYYIHTTPEDERATAAGQAIFLANSHGCIHLVPTERDQMIGLGYLHPGVDFEVRPYNETGP